MGKKFILNYLSEHKKNLGKLFDDLREQIIDMGEADKEDTELYTEYSYADTSLTEAYRLIFKEEYE